MINSFKLTELLQYKTQLLDTINNFSAFRPGSLVGRFRKCGKPRCHCAKPGAKGHGPSWSLTRSIKGKTVTKIIPKEHVATTFQQIDEYHHFQEVVHQLVETNVNICDARLESSIPGSDGPHEAEKKG